MFKYFGSKHRLAPTYQAPRYDTIVEPFAGAAAYAMYWMQQRSDLRAVLFDIDPVVVEMWQVLLGMDPEVLWHYPVPEAGTRTTDPIYKAACAGDNGWNVRGGEYQVTGWMADGFVHIRRRMAHTLALVRGRVTVELADYTTAPDLEATWFIDPPYQREGHRYAVGNDLDFAALGAWSRSRRGQVIVCETYGADWMDFEPHVTNQTVSTSSSVEAVWYSDPEPNLFSEVPA